MRKRWRGAQLAIAPCIPAKPIALCGKRSWRSILSAPFAERRRQTLTISGRIKRTRSCSGIRPTGRRCARAVIAARPRRRTEDTETGGGRPGDEGDPPQKKVLEPPAVNRAALKFLKISPMKAAQARMRVRARIWKGWGNKFCLEEGPRGSSDRSKEVRSEWLRRSKRPKI